VTTPLTKETTERWIKIVRAMRARVSPEQFETMAAKILSQRFAKRLDFLGLPDDVRLAYVLAMMGALVDEIPAARAILECEKPGNTLLTAMEDFFQCLKG
jgi:hypothetical protein